MNAECHKCSNSMHWEYTTDGNGGTIAICGVCGSWNPFDNFWINDALGAMVDRPMIVGSGFSSAKDIRAELASASASSMTTLM